MKGRLITPTHWVYILVHAILIIGGYTLASSGGSLRVGIGASLIAAGVTGWVIFVYMLVAQRVSERVRIVTEFGFTNAFAGRSVLIKAEYDKRLQQAHSGIDIMGFGLKTLREDYHDEFARCRVRASVRILMIDPRFPDAATSYAWQRDTEEQDNPGSIQTNVDRFLKDIGPLVGSSGVHRFEIRLYRCLPSVNLFRVDDEMFWGPYLIGGQSRNNPTFIVRRGGQLFTILQKHFDDIWRDDRLSVSLADYITANPTTAETTE